jgi:hypothetical protein
LAGKTGTDHAIDFENVVCPHLFHSRKFGEGSHPSHGLVLPCHLGYIKSIGDD